MYSARLGTTLMILSINTEYKINMLRQHIMGTIDSIDTKRRMLVISSGWSALLQTSVTFDNSLYFGLLHSVARGFTI